MRVAGKTPKQKIQNLASSQQGFFSAQQAIAVGYAPNNHSYHVRRKNWVREQRGIYRLARMPRTQEGQYVIWSLWSISSQDDSLSPQGVFSHATALDLHSGSDVLPSKFHLSVPTTFKQRKKVKGLVLHRADLEDEDTEARDGYRITTPLRTLLDGVRSETVPTELIAQALARFLKQGLISLETVKGVPELMDCLALADVQPETEMAVQLLRQAFAAHLPQQKPIEKDLQDVAIKMRDGIMRVFEVMTKGLKMPEQRRQMRRTDRVQSKSKDGQAMEDRLAEQIRAKQDPELLKAWLEFLAANSRDGSR